MDYHFLSNKVLDNFIINAKKKIFENLFTGSFNVHLEI